VLADELGEISFTRADIGDFHSGFNERQHQLHDLVVGAGVRDGADFCRH
jgi:hypothetical protein